MFLAPVPWEFQEEEANSWRIWFFPHTVSICEGLDVNWFPNPTCNEAICWLGDAKLPGLSVVFPFVRSVFQRHNRKDNNTLMFLCCCCILLLLYKYRYQTMLATLSTEILYIHFAMVVITEVQLVWWHGIIIAQSVAEVGQPAVCVLTQVSLTLHSLARLEKHPRETNTCLTRGWANGIESWYIMNIHEWSSPEPRSRAVMRNASVSRRRRRHRFHLSKQPLGWGTKCLYSPCPELQIRLWKNSNHTKVLFT